MRLWVAFLTALRALENVLADRPPGSAQPPEQLSPWAIVAGRTLGCWALFGHFNRIGRGWRLGAWPAGGASPETADARS